MYFPYEKNPKEPTTKSVLFEYDNIIVTPHLGASTTEAQAMTAKEIAEQVVNVLKGQPSRYAVNSPFISAEALSTLMPFLGRGSKRRGSTEQEVRNIPSR